MSTLTLYTKIHDIKQLSNSEKLAHYAGLVPKVKQSSEHTGMGRESKGNKWLKRIFIEASWSHIRFCPEVHLARVFEDTSKEKEQ